MTSLSKSQARAMGCETYFTQYYADRVPQIPSKPATVGSDYHRFAAEYVAHLVDSGLQADHPWAHEWLTSNPVEDEARGMITKELPYINIDPEKVFGTEVFVALDRDFKRLPDVPNPGLGKSPAESYIHGTLDLVQIDGLEILVEDFKTGWMTKVDPYEAVHYAVLAFALYPAAVTVRFRWRFIRAGAPKEKIFHVSDLDWLLSIVRSKVAQRDELEGRYRAGAPVSANPLSGLCGYCALECPVRTLAMRGQCVYAPIQTADDAVAAMGTIVSIRSVQEHLEGQLAAYLDHSECALDSGGYRAAIEAKATMSIPLRAGLEVLGVELPPTGLYDVDLDSLRIGTTEIKRLAKAKKRAGLMEALEAVAEMKPRSELRIGLTE